MKKVAINVKLLPHSPGLFTLPESISRACVLVQVSAWACGAVCNSVLSRVPIVGPLVTVGEPEKPSLPVRVMRRGIRMAYGTAGAVSGTGAGMLSAPQILFRRRPAS